MSVLNQKTIKKNIIFKGVGLHSGLEVNLTIKPAEPNTGIIFKRTDIKENNIVLPNIFNVSSAIFCTTISNDNGVSISTVEHLMGALYGLGVDNLLVEIDNIEVPDVTEIKTDIATIKADVQSLDKDIKKLENVNPLAG